MWLFIIDTLLRTMTDHKTYQHISLDSKDRGFLHNVSNETGYKIMGFSIFRRGIGWHLLKASEELISQMSSTREAYLHCRMIDTAPFNMYKKAGYDIVKTDNILVMLLLQRRKHLMCKKLPVLTSFSESDTFCSEEELTS